MTKESRSRQFVNRNALAECSVTSSSGVHPKRYGSDRNLGYRAFPGFNWYKLYKKSEGVNHFCARPVSYRELEGVEGDRGVGVFQEIMRLEERFDLFLASASPMWERLGDWAFRK